MTHNESEGLTLDYAGRMLLELAALEARIKRLREFISSGMGDDLHVKQYEGMQQYRSALAERVSSLPLGDDVPAEPQQRDDVITVHVSAPAGHRAEVKFGSGPDGVRATVVGGTSQIWYIGKNDILTVLRGVPHATVVSSAKPE